MSWEKEIKELRRREALAKKMGGPDKVKRQHDGGKLTVRERVDRLLDKDSFHEIGGLAGVAPYGADGELADFTPANLVMGRGRIGGGPAGAPGGRPPPAGRGAHAGPTTNSLGAGRALRGTAR